MTLHLNARDWLERRASGPSAGPWSSPTRRPTATPVAQASGVGLRLGAHAAGPLGLYGPAAARDNSSAWPLVAMVAATARASSSVPHDTESATAGGSASDTAAYDSAPSDGVPAVDAASPGDESEAATGDPGDEPAEAAADPIDGSDDAGNEDEPAVTVRRVGSFVATQDIVSVQIAASASDYRNRVAYSLDDGQTWQELGYDNEGLEAPAELHVGTGARVLFGIENPDGYQFVAGREDLSADGLDHARIDAMTDHLRVGFEDLAGGGDLDFDDAVIEVRGASWQPEGATIEEATSAESAADAAIEQAAWEDQAEQRAEREEAEAERQSRADQVRHEQALASHNSASTLVRWRADGQAQLLQALTALSPLPAAASGIGSPSGDDRPAEADRGAPGNEGPAPRERHGKAWGRHYAVEPAASRHHWQA